MAVSYLPQYETQETPPIITPPASHFVCPVGGDHDSHSEKKEKAHKKVPVSNPSLTLTEIFDLRAFRSLDLWKCAFLECMASMMNVFISAWVTLHPITATEPPRTELGIYHTLTFYSPLFGGITNLLLTPSLIVTFGPLSGGHVNPIITISTFFARSISFPRAILYLAGQLLGGALAGFAIYRAYGSRNFTVGGCYVDTSIVPVGDAFVIEFFACLTLVFVVFGVALDPRQAKVVGPMMGPWLIGIVLGLLCWATAFTRPGYIGASLNPARCFGVYVASKFPGYHWVHWVGPTAASFGHGLVYFLEPYWSDIARRGKY